MNVLISCLTLGLVSISQAQHAIITKTVYSTCSISRSSFPFPSWGWISTNGTTVPFTFDSATASNENNIGFSSASIRATETSITTTPSQQSTPRTNTVLPTSSATCVSDNGIPISCPRSNGTVFAPSGFCSPAASNSSYLVLCGQILQSDEIRSRQNIQKAEECVSLCSAESACVAVAFDVLRQSCSLRSSATLSTRDVDTSIAFIIDLKYYVELKMQQPPQTMPSTSIPLSPTRSSASVTELPTSASAQSNGTPTSNAVPTLSNDLSSISSAMSFISSDTSSISSEKASTSSATPTISPYIYGGSIVTTVFGGTTRTYASGGVPTAIVTGGLTTTYTSGGTTTFVTVTAIATSTPSAVAEAEIGLCPAYDGKVYQGSGDALLVGCGVVYSGTVISSNTRRAIDRRATANECSSQCVDTAECVAMSFTGNTCTLYSTVEGQRNAIVPAFSAVRLTLDATNAGNSSSAQFSGMFTGTSMKTDAQTTDIGQPIATTTQITTVVSVSTSTVVLQIPPSTFTQVIPASTITLVSSAPGQTTTAIFTSIQPQATTTITLSMTQLVTYTTTGPVSTLISTLVSTLSAFQSTQIVTTTKEASILLYTTTIVSVVPASTLVSTQLATTTQQGTTAVSTERITFTASASTLTITTILPLFSTIVSIPPAETVISLQTVTSTVPASTLTIESISTVLLTSTAPGQITTAIFTSLVTESVTTTLPASITIFVISITETLHTTEMSTLISIPEASTITTTYATTLPAETLVSTQLASTITETLETTLPANTLTEATTIVSTQLASTITETLETTLPANTLILPTTIVSTQLASTLTTTREITPPAETLTQPLTIVSTQLASTITETVETTQPLTIITTQLASTITTTRETTELTTIVSTQLASTITTTQISTPPSITLTQPTTIYSVVVSSVPVTYTTSYVETSISVSTAPGSTITATATSLVYSTFVSTLNVTETTSRVETRTEITTQPPTTIVSTQYVAGASPVPTCLSSNNGQIYTASDGSQYMILCGQGNAGYNLYGVTVSASGYSSCIQKCSAQGTACNGVTWQASSSTCTLKKRMYPASALQMGASSDTDSALRLTGPSGANSRSQLVTNGGFDTGDFSYWTLNLYTGVSANVVNNVATLAMNSQQYAYGYLLQNFAAMAGNNYLIGFNVSMTGPGTGSCSFAGVTDTDSMNNQRFTSGSVIQPPTIVYSSGILRSNITQFGMLAECSQGPGWTVLLDDIAFYTYSLSPGYEPAPVVPVVLVANANYSYSNSANQQYTIPTIQEAQTFTLTANVQVSVPGGTTCTLQLGFQYSFFPSCSYSDPNTFFCQAFSTSGAYVINVRSEPAYSYSSLVVSLYCSGSSGSTVALNNLYLTVNT